MRLITNYLYNLEERSVSLISRMEKNDVLHVCLKLFELIKYVLRYIHKMLRSCIYLRATPRRRLGENAVLIAAYTRHRHWYCVVVRGVCN